MSDACGVCERVVTASPPRGPCHVCGRVGVVLLVRVRSGTYLERWTPNRSIQPRLERWLRPGDTPLPIERRMTFICLDRVACFAHRDAKSARQRLRSKVPADVTGRQLFESHGGVCKWCGEAIYRKDKDGRIVVHKQRMWHDGREVDPRAEAEPQCLSEYLAQKRSTFRRAVELRDHGVCAQCGRHVVAEHEEWVDLVKQITDAFKPRRDALYEQREAYYQDGDNGYDWRAFHRDMQALAEEERAAIGRFTDERPQPTWEADHVIPLEDGGEHLMANAQTLCTPCHRAKTAEENRRRAARRRQQRDEWELTMELNKP